MLQENEVRIGNAVKDSTGRIGTIMSIGKNQVRVRFEFSTVKIDTNHDETGLDVDGIPLTEEILLKCGYSESDLENGKILVVGESFDNVIGYTIRSLSSSIVVKTVHQLQNLVYALTNKELDIVW